MLVVRDGDEVPGLATGSAVTIGAYDGVHLGHRAVIAQVRALAAAGAWPPWWSPSTGTRPSVVRPESAPLLLTDLDQKLELLAGDRRRRHPRRPLRRGAGQGAGRGVRRRGARRLPRRPGRRGRRGLPLRPPAPRQRRAAARPWAPTHGFEVAGRRTWSASTATPRRPATPSVVHRHPRRARRRRRAPAPTPARPPPRGAGRRRPRRQAGPRPRLPHGQRAGPRRRLPAGRRHLRRLVPAPRRRRPAGRHVARATADLLRATSPSRCSRPTCSTSPATSTASRPGSASCSRLRGELRFESVDDLVDPDGPSTATTPALSLASR